MPGLVKELVDLLVMLNDTFHNIYFMIENVNTYDVVTQFCNGATPKDVYRVVELFKSHGFNNLFITLDICHAIMTAKEYYRFFNNTELLSLENNGLPDVSIENWFRTCGMYLRNIHISDCVGDGVLPLHHGAVMTESSYPLIEELIDLSVQYCSADLLWTVEVAEVDYSDCINQLVTTKHILHVLSNH